MANSSTLPDTGLEKPWFTDRATRRRLPGRTPRWGDPVAQPAETQGLLGDWGILADPASHEDQMGRLPPRSKELDMSNPQRQPENTQAIMTAAEELDSAWMSFALTIRDDYRLLNRQQLKEVKDILVAVEAGGPSLEEFIPGMRFFLERTNEWIAVREEQSSTSTLTRRVNGHGERIAALES